MPTRRQFLGATAAATGLALVGSPAAAEHPDRQPAHVTIAYDQSRLERYKPLIDIRPVDRELLEGLFGWIAESPEHDTDVMGDWCRYRRQVSPWWAPGTGHWGDHEPVQVEVDSDTGDPVRVRASVYHWIKGETRAETVPMDGDNPRLRVVSPYHQYTATGPDAAVRSLAVKDLTAHFDNWLANGLEADLVPGAAYNPWIMRTESDFWREGEFGLPANETLRAETARTLGFGQVGDLTG
jgi:hypothetical protein